jgi:2-polyprenyl-6-methoxyphenol hydroxylase-like FAD-dependent oxidoreductase
MEQDAIIVRPYITHHARSPASPTSSQIGGSIAGLMCGIMLKHHGHHVTILEQDPAPVRHGYDAGISIRFEVEEFLRKHDRVKREMVVTCLPGIKINFDGSSKATRGQTMTMPNSSWGLMVSVLRANFDGVGAETARSGDGEAVFRSGARVTGVNDVGGVVDVHLENTESGKTETISADMVIVADGSNSGIRKLLLPDVRREYMGYMCWRGTVREEGVAEKWNDLYAKKATFHLMDKSYLLK